MKITTKLISRRKRRQNLYQTNALSALAGAAAGTAATYWLDPHCGPERRERVLSGASRAVRGTGDALRAAPQRLTRRMRNAGREVQERAEGVAEQAQHALRDAGDGAWAPLPRLLAGAAGVGLVNWSLSQRSLPTAAAGAVGLALLARSATNAPLSELPRVFGTKRGAEPAREVPHGEESPEFRTTLGEALASGPGEGEQRLSGGPAEGAGEGRLRTEER